ncbi:MAG: hypothetical protein QW292_12630 [Candidatus Parvarchaeota archaeon]
MKSNWFYDFIDKRMKRNQGVLALFVGPMGSGKSYSALSASESIDSSFSVDRVTFTVEDFVKLVAFSNLPPGSCVIFDDAGLGINHRQWMEKQNNVMNMVVQTNRFRQIITFITTPKMTFIDKDVRILFDVIFTMNENEQGTGSPRLVIESKSMDGKILYPYPRINDGGKIKRLTKIYFELPSKSLIQAYEKKRKEYVDAIQRKVFNELVESQKIDEMERSLKMQELEMRQKKIDAWKSRSSRIMNGDYEPIRCEVCNKEFQREYDYQVHLTSKNHKKMVEKMKNAPTMTTEPQAPHI